MMKKEKFNEENYLTVLNCAIANAVYTGDTQVVFDGEDFHWEEVVCQEFIRGYVIRHSDYDISQIPEGSENGEKPNDFQNWLADQLFYHANKCWEYFKIKKMKTLKEIQQELLSKSKEGYVSEVIAALDGLNIAEALDVLDEVKKKYCEMFSDNPTEWFGESEPIKPPSEDNDNNEDITDYDNLPF